MQITTSVATTLEHMFAIEIPDNESYASILINGMHRIISIDPTIIAFVRELQTTLAFAHLTTDKTPTDADITYQILRYAPDLPLTTPQ